MELRKLSREFYIEYDSQHFPQILQKENRAYVFFYITIDGIDFALPIKTNISHSNGFIFTKSGRRKSNEKPGIDFTKAIAIMNNRFLGDNAYIDKLEFENHKIMSAYCSP